MKQEFKIIEVFNKNKPDIKNVIQDVFKIYIENKINSEYNLNIKK